jgi:protein SCO1/2
VSFPFARLGLYLVLLLAGGQALAQPAVFRGLHLQDHRLQNVTSRALAGQPLLLNFVFAGCTTVCPVQLQALQQLREALPPATRAQLQFVSVTVDPLSDTPQALARFARARGLDLPGWRFVSGPPAQVHTLLDRMQVFGPAAARGPNAAPPEPADHRSAVYLFSADGQLLQRFRGSPIDQARLLADIQTLIRVQP